MPTVDVVEQSGDAHDGSAPRRRLPGGEAGICVLILGDMMVFAILFVVYLHSRGLSPELFAESQDSLNRDAGAINTMVLLCSSLLVVWGVHAARTGGQGPAAWKLMLAGLAVGALFVVIKIYEYTESVSEGITPTTNEFFMYYFLLTGLHLVHVLIGLCVLGGLTWLARQENRSRTRVGLVEAGGCFWHMVDLLWLVIFPLVFLVR